MTTHLFHPLANPRDNGRAISELFASSGTGTTVLLVRNAVYPLYTSIIISHDDCHLATEGSEGSFPSIESGQQAILETRGTEATCVNLIQRSRCSVRHIHMKGLRGWGANKPTDEERSHSRQLGWIEGGGALVLMGGPDSHESVLDSCRLEDPRGWTGCHVADFAERCQVTRNVVGPSGQQAAQVGGGGGPWADGLSIAGRNTIVSDNVIVDATDGAIVVFCAPGSIISRNTIIARTRDVLGGINMVDDFPFSCDYTNTRVENNTVKSEGAFVRLAYGIGPTCWSPYNQDHTLNFGGAVRGNTIGPGTIGYGIAVSGAKDWVVEDNVVAHGTNFCGSTNIAPDNGPPMAFLVDHSHVKNCLLQQDFVAGEASYLIGLGPGAGSALNFRNGQLKLFSNGEGLAGVGGIELENSTVVLDRNGVMSFRDKETRKDRWASHAGRENDDYDPVLEFGNGRLTVKSRQGHELWSPTQYLQSHVDAQVLKTALLTLAAQQPFVTVRDDRNILFATRYEFGPGFTMHGGDWISIAPRSTRGIENPPSQHRPLPPTNRNPPPVPQRPHQLSSLLKNVGEKMTEKVSQKLSEMNITPPIPPRMTSATSSLSTIDTRGIAPTFLFLNGKTGQLILHSSPSPTEVKNESIHWIVPQVPQQVDTSFFSFQGDGNLVLYTKTGDQDGVSWASATNGDEDERGALISLRGVDDEGGRGFLLLDRLGRDRLEGQGCDSRHGN